MKPKLLLLTLLLTAYCQLLTGTVRYVSKTGSATPPYTSWATASDSIQKCITICQNGDTVYVANGVYKETLIINKEIALIGSSMDSTVIDSRELSGTGLDSLITIDFIAKAQMENVNVIGKGINKQYSTAIVTTTENISIMNCRISNAQTGILTFYTSSIVRNVIIANVDLAFRSPCFPDTCNPILDSCIIILNNPRESALGLTYGSPTITNNIIIDEGELREKDGIYIDVTKKAIVKNNLVSGFGYNNIEISGIEDSVIVHYNNTLYGPTRINSVNASILTYTGSKTSVKNNVIGNSYRGLTADLEPVESNYNLFWDNVINTSGYATFNDSDLTDDPMFVKDTIPRSSLSFDFHLQKFSPAIDKGDPNILDKDGTQSDIGMYGGPFGEIYTYQDFAPRPPRNLSGFVDSSKIKLRWNKNTEADTSYYKVYRDTVQNFAIDSTKLISSQTDTIYSQTIPHKVSKYVYKITCVDKQGNESNPSEEREVNITSINDFQMTINDYFLYQNYPNPFNPNTTIGYKLKGRGYVKLMVYDIKGELVSVLVNQEQEQGYYEVDFSISSIQHQISGIQNFASGIYLYRIEVIGEGNIPVYTEMKKMMLIK